MKKNTQTLNWLENYNDSEVSLPHGFVGEGIFNGPKFDNPAWGGQFQLGGSVYPVNYVPQAQNGWLEKLESKVEGFIGKPMNRGTTYAHDDIKNKKSDELDTLRHAYTAMETSNAIKKATGNIPFISDQLAFVGTNVLGAGHELTHLFKSTPDELRESGEDIINNFTGSLAGLIPFVSDDNKRKAIQYLSNKGILPDGTTAGRGRTYEAINKKYAMGGSLPRAVGFSYARTQSPAPSNGKYAKKTMASAQNGKEMQYYQNGLDWKPKSISRDGSVIKDDRGQWDHPGEITEIGSNEITMEGVPYDVLGVSDTGDTKLMKPGKNYKFKGKKVTEYPMAKNGVNQQDQKTLQQLDQLTNFTNYNKPQPGGWLNKYN